MGLLDGMLGQLAGQALGGGQGQGQTGGGNQALVRAVLGMLSGGGLSSLLQGFQNHGLGHVAGSWVGTGENHPISPEQLEQGLGSDRLDELSRSAGLDRQTTASHLSQLLPSLVDRLTPHGQVPEGNALEQGLGSLSSLLR